MTTNRIIHEAVSIIHEAVSPIGQRTQEYGCGCVFIDNSSVDGHHGAESYWSHRCDQHGVAAR